MRERLDGLLRRLLGERGGQATRRRQVRTRARHRLRGGLGRLADRLGGLASRLGRTRSGLASVRRSGRLRLSACTGWWLGAASGATPRGCGRTSHGGKSAEDLGDLLSLLARALDLRRSLAHLVGELAELLAGLADLLGDRAQVYLRGLDGDAEHLLLLLERRAPEQDPAGDTNCAGHGRCDDARDRGATTVVVRGPAVARGARVPGLARRGLGALAVTRRAA